MDDRPKVPLGRMHIDDEMREAILRILNSGHRIKGPELKASPRVGGVLRSAWRRSMQQRIRGLIAALKVLGVGAGDEVIVPSHTYISSATCIELIGAHPVFVEVEPGYHTVALDAIKAAYTPNTKAVIAVHLYGQPVAREARVVRSQGLPVIEDAAQGHGASLDGDRVGHLAKSPPSPSSRAKTWPWVATAGPSSSTRQTCCTLFRCSLTTAVPANTRTIHWERTSVF